MTTLVNERRLGSGHGPRPRRSEFAAFVGTETTKFGEIIAKAQIEK